MYEQGTADEYNFLGEWVGVQTPAQIAQKRYLQSLERDPEKEARIAEGKKKIARTLAVPILFSLLTGA